MRGLSFLAFVFLAILCWGIHGPILYEGQSELGSAGELNRLRAFTCVGIAYSLISVFFSLYTLRREAGAVWSVAGIIWSFAAGTISAIGAVGIILAFHLGGSPIIVMPLVFGCVPVVYAVANMLVARSIRQAPVAFYLGIFVVIIGAAGIIFFQPGPQSDQLGFNNSAGLQASFGASDPLRNNLTINGAGIDWPMIGLIGVTAVCWGCYGPLIHQGQVRMGGSRIRPFMFIGLAYFLFAVLLPITVQVRIEEPGQWNIWGASWSLAAGAAAAIGALGIVYAFNRGGKPVFVMTLVFAGAPMVNTFFSSRGGNLSGQMSWLFYISLFVVIVGAVTVLVCVPRANSN